MKTLDTQGFLLLYYNFNTISIIYLSVAVS
nr:MAG TPA: hypothetical protein [Caudoviricetes sp.]